MVLIPAFNEEEAISKVIKDIPKTLVSEVVVINNASTDKTEEQAQNAGATVLRESRRGYGFACLKGIGYLKSKTESPSIVVFMDGDYSDHPNELESLVSPILHENRDLVIGSRELGEREKGSMTVPQIFGNWLATRLLKMVYGVSYTDLGPFRAIRWEKLLALNMQDQTFGWTVEMQAKAGKLGLPYTEVPVSYRKRIGFSKISGTVKGTILAGYKIIWTIFKVKWIG